MVSKNKCKTFFFVFGNFENSACWSQKKKKKKKKKKKSSSFLLFSKKKKKKKKKNKDQELFPPPHIWLLVPFDEKLQVGNMFISDRV